MSIELYDIADYALKQLKAKGADGADVYISRGRMDELNLDAGKFSLMRTTFSNSTGVRALSNSRKGSYNINKIDQSSVSSAVDAALDAAKSSEPDSAEVISGGIGEHVFDLVQTESDADLMYDRMVEFMDRVKQEYPKTEVMQFIVSHNRWEYLYANSNSTKALTKASQYNVSVTFSAKDGERTSSFNGSGYAAKGLSFPILDYPDMRRLISGSAMELEAKPVDGKFVGVLLCSPDSLYCFLAQVLGNCVSGGALIEGSSPWKDKIGQKVADERINLSYAPLHERIINGGRLQDGYLAYNQDIIKDGKLASFALSEYAALKTGLPRAGATGNIVVAPGTSSVDELVAGIERGVLINRFSGGSMTPNGDFSGVAKNSFLIEDGKITDAVTETMVSGNMLEMLQNMAGIGSELDCGGGSVIPWASFNGVVISGK